ncbi:MAG TPA: amidohydrolase family protein [Gemmatimonadaceae bacterium]|nr:amidohydrolase family protein [Gemmatimonadaceae bacterium]
MLKSLLFSTAAVGSFIAMPASAQRPKLAPAVRQFVAIDTDVVAITHVRVIDGTGAPARADQTLIIRDGRIASLGDAAQVAVPAGARVVDGTGKSVIPGLVMMHEHLFYPTSPVLMGAPPVYANLTESFVRLYLAGGVTSMRTGGNMNGFAEIEIKQAIDRGDRAGPWIDATAPYLEGPGLNFMQVHELKDAADARALIDYWHGIGATSLKAYMHITRDELKASVAEGHKLGMKITGHLCSVTYREAAALGIDDLEHGFFASTDFAPNKKPDVCPGQAATQAVMAAMDPASDSIKSLIRDLIQHHVALTSTLTVFETYTPGRPVPPGIDVLDPLLRDQFLQLKTFIDHNPASLYGKLFPKMRQWEVDFFHAGGLLLAGTDPTGGGGVIPGYSDQRQLELLVEGGLTPLEAIKVCTLNGATYLGRANTIGSVAVGKQADLVLIDGDPSARIEDVRKVSVVFKDGIGYDPTRLIASVKGRVGLF